MEGWGKEGKRRKVRWRYRREASMNAWEKIAWGEVSGVNGIVEVRIRYSMLVAVDVTACF